jgi:hypothetical protein
MMQTEEKDKMAITTRGMPRQLWRDFRSIAVAKGYTVNELLTILIMEYLSRER